MDPTAGPSNRPRKKAKATSSKDGEAEIEYSISLAEIQTQWIGKLIDDMQAKVVGDITCI